MTVYFRPDAATADHTARPCPFKYEVCNCDCALFLERINDHDEVPCGACAFAVIAYALNKDR